eukprot:TRINITY_DN3450_c0_g3_i2.p2 TRINITY_DN3450_c0_g3~~TRINITY_DN3450_c0_g3_i2.p2  ORF type:complete len:175 (-),score=69.23 TRINITY_DN3450_c0_g3_i2:298-822(-)
MSTGTQLTTNSSVDEIRKHFSYLTKAQIEECKANFKRFDENQDGNLNLFEVTLLLEAVGRAKTHVEARKFIAEHDRSGSGTINFNDFIHAVFPPDGKPPIVIKGRIAQSSLAGSAKFFEEKAQANTADSKEDLEKKIKAEAALRKEEKEEKRKQKEKEESKKKFQEKFSAFEQK